MKKKKLSQALPRKLTSAEIIDFCAYIHGGISAGLSIDQAIAHATLFLESPLREGAEVYSYNRRMGMDKVDALCTFANSYSEEAIRRLMKMLIFASSHGGSIPSLVEILIRSLERGQGLEQNLTGELDPSELKLHFPDLDDTPTLPAPESSVLQLSDEYLEKQKFWQFINKMIDADQSILISGFPSLERTQLIRRLQKKFIKTLEFNSAKPIEFLTSMAQQSRTLGVVNGPNLRAALSQIDIYASELRMSPSVIHNSLCQIFTFGISLGTIGKHSFVHNVSEIMGVHGDLIVFQDIFTVKTSGYSKDRKPVGYYSSTGIIPSVIYKLERDKLIDNMSTYFSNT